MYFQHGVLTNEHAAYIVVDSARISIKNSVIYMYMYHYKNMQREESKK